MENSIVQHRRGTTAEWEQYKDIVLKEGEISVEFCDDGTALLKVGDGVRAYSDLKDIGVSREKIEEIINNNNSVSTIEKLTAKLTSVEENLDELEENVSDQQNKFILLNSDGMNLEYIENKLYLRSGDHVVSEVEIVGGSGSGSGSSYIDYGLTCNIGNSLTISKNDPCYIDFNFYSIKMPHNKPTGNFTAEIVVSNIVKATHTLTQGDNRVDISASLNTGENSVTLRCYDAYGNVETKSFSVNVIELVITSTFNDAIIQEDEIQFRISSPGTIDKTLHILVDDEEKVSQYIKKSTTYTAKLPKQTHGEHRIKAFVTATISEETIYSNILEYSFISIDESDLTPVISSSFRSTTIKQGTLISIPYVVYDRLSSTAAVKLTIYNGTGKSKEVYKEQELFVDRKKQYWNTRDFPAGDVEFVISCGNTLKVFVMQVTESDLHVEPITDNLQLFLSSAGRSNTEKNPATWEFEGITTDFENFNWRTNGWIEDNNNSTCLRLNGDAKAYINFKPFEKEIKRYGQTLEFEFAVRDVNTRDDIVMSCWSNGIGFQVTPDKVILSNEKNSIECNYKENSRVRVGFTIESSDTETMFVSMYLDGVLSGVTRYERDTNMTQNPAVGITLGSPNCGVDLYSIRVYNAALTFKEILQNYIADTEDFVTKSSVYENNDIYDSYTGLLSYSKLKEKIPTVTFIGKMPTYKGDKRPYKDEDNKPIPETEVRMIFEHPQHPELNFDELVKQIDVQGTSSAGYVRKNWKTKHNTEHTHMTNELPAKVYCLKVDYAEATGTHNTQNANLIETFYVNPVPPKKEKDFPTDFTEEQILEIKKLRTTIAGFPIVIFHLDTEDPDLIKNITTAELAIRDDVIFSSKGNFNYDKDAEDVFGFNDNYDVECWEFLKNEDPQSFLTPWPEEPLNYWEARYHPRLGELEDLQDANNTTAAKALGDEMLSRFREMYEWVHSTARGYYNGKPQASGNRLSTSYIDKVNGTVFEYDTDEYRLAKFRDEFENYFNSYYAAVYYVYTFFALMVDQRAKNMFLTYWRDNAYGPKDETNPGKWYPYFYDNDTSYGISNKGHLDFDYYHQDRDSKNGSNVFNGANSVLWVNFADAFPTLIADTYKSLRNRGIITYDKIIDRFVTNGSDMWSASVYNEDANYKYISVESDVVEGNEQAYPYLFQIRGNGEQHLKYFVENRIKFCDSKWKCGDYLNTDRQSRINIYNPTTSEDYQNCERWDNTPVDIRGPQPEYYVTYKRIKESTTVRPPSSTLSIKPYSRIYYGVQYGAESGDDVTKTMVSKLATRTADSNAEDKVDDSILQFSPPSEWSAGLNDFETMIYGAPDVSSYGDLSNLYAKEIDVSRSVKLVELIVGCREKGENGETYYNPNLTTLTTGNNTLLKKIDVSNCPNLKMIDLKGCLNIREIYAEGSGLTSVSLPDAGYITTMWLPDTITNLTLKNQSALVDLKFQGYNTLQTLRIENCPNIDAKELLNKCKNDKGEFTLNRLGLNNIDWEFDNTDFLDSLSNIQGIDVNGDTTPHACLSGTCKIRTLTGAQLTTLNNFYPDLDILFTNLDFNATYKNDDGSDIFVDGKPLVIPYHIPSEEQKLENPDKLYWSSKNDRISILDPVKEGLIEEPSRASSGPTAYKYAGWSTSVGGEAKLNALEGIVSDVVRYVAFSETVRQCTVSFYNGNQFLKTIKVDYNTRADYGDLSQLKVSGTAIPYVFDRWEPSVENVVDDIICKAQFKLDETKVYILTEDNLGIVEKNDSNSTLTIKGLKGVTNDVTVIKVPQCINYEGKDYTVTSIGGFEYTPVVYVELPEGLKTIQSGAFNECTNLELVTIPKTVISIGSRAFRKCYKLTKIYLPSGLTTLSEQLLQNCKGITEINIPETVTSLQSMSIYSTSISYINIPASVDDIGFYAFKDCSNLKVINFNRTPSKINLQAFKELKNLTINTTWREGEVKDAPWGAIEPIINYID